MLCMGFIDDVELILSYVLEECQIVLFFVIMLGLIKKIMQCYLNDFKYVKIEFKVSIVSIICQCYCQVVGYYKFEVLICIMEVEFFDGMIIFVCIKIVMLELVEKLVVCGYDVELLNGDIFQVVCECIVDCLK